MTDKFIGNEFGRTQCARRVNAMDGIHQCKHCQSDKNRRGGVYNMKCLRCLARLILNHPYGLRRKLIDHWAVQHKHSKEELKAQIIHEHKAQQHS